MKNNKEQLSKKIHELSYKHDNEIMMAHDDLMEMLAQNTLETLESVIEIVKIRRYAWREILKKDPEDDISSNIEESLSNLLKEIEQKKTKSLDSSHVKKDRY